MKEKYKKAMKSIEEVRPKKFHYANKTVVMMPSPVAKKDLTDYQYGIDIDERVLKMATSLAERMAVSLVREAMSMNTAALVDEITERLSAKIAEAMPEQATVIQQVVSAERADIKRDAGEFTFEEAEFSINRAKGMKLHGKVGEKTNTKESTDETLDALDNLQL